MLLAAAAITAALCAQAARADCQRAGDRILLVSTRPVGCSTDAIRLAECAVASERVINDCRASWNESSVADLLASLDPATPVVVFVHGNQIAPCDVRPRGMAVYRRLVRCADDDRPIQFVMFSWASTKVPGVLRDFREKAARTRPVAWQLAWTINQMPASAPVGLIGYSYGARVTTGATHLLAGGQLNGLSISDAAPGRAVRTVYLAPALDACWLRANGYHGLSLTRSDSTLMTCNTSDPAMRFFRFSSKCSNPQALGYTGPIGLHHEYSDRVRVCGVSSTVGKSHDLYRYISSSSFMRKAWQSVSFSDTAVAGSPTVAEAPAATVR